MQCPDQEASHFEMGALWCPAPERADLGFAGPVGAERMNKWRHDAMIFAHLWNVSPFAACGVDPFSGCLPSVWGA